MQYLNKSHFSHFIKQLILILLVCKIYCASGEIYFKKGSPQVKLSHGGILSGRLDFSREGRPFTSFVGVPYGKIPGRFEEAQLASPWVGSFGAAKPGQECVKPAEVSGKVILLGREDCLSLNVYVPMNNTQSMKGYPVMVMVHGGSFRSGNGYILAPTYFMDEDVILVTINYRLGAFGFLSTGDSVVPGNNGLKDQVLALQWVKENIKNFGGDPELVTVAGQGAGGASIHYLFLSPTTNGLFQRAIAQSGSAMAPWAYNPNPRATSVKLATYLNCSTEASTPSEISSEEIATCLKGLSFKELNEAQLKFNSRWPPKYAGAADFVPVSEPKNSKSPFFTDSPWNITEPLKELPFITGTTEDEGVSEYSGFILGDQNLLEELDLNWENIILKTLQLERFVPPVEQKIVKEKIRKFYFGEEKVSTEMRVNLTNMFSDALFVHSGRRTALETATKGGKNPVYLYQYAFQGSVSIMKLFGFSVPDEESKKVCHGDDIMMHFNVGNLFPNYTITIHSDSPQEEFSKNFVKLWVSFAIHGKPTHTWGNLRQDWKPISQEEIEGKSPLMWYKLDSNPGYIEEGGIKERSEFWEELYKDHILPYLSLPLSSG